MVLGVGLTVYIAACQLMERISWHPHGRRRRNILRELFGYPVCVLFLELRHDDDLVAWLAVEGRDILHIAVPKGVLP